MKFILHKLTVAVSLLVGCQALAQQPRSLNLKTGLIRPAANIRQDLLDVFHEKAVYVAGKTFALLQFENLPSATRQEMLQKAGIKLLQYTGSNTYTATLTLKPDATLYKQAGIVALIDIEAKQKIDPALSAVPAKSIVKAWISFSPAFTLPEVVTALKALEIDTLSAKYSSYGVLGVRLAAGLLLSLAAQPFVEYIQPEPAPDQPLNNTSRDMSRSSYYNAAVADGGRGLRGEGVVVGIGDNANLQDVIDFNSRLIDRNTAAPNNHGTHVAGTLAGGGIVNELYRGHAPKATIVSQAFSDIIVNSPAFVQDYNMVVTNNSYGSLIGCSANGNYDNISRVIDQQALSFPHLEHVFAVGNSGTVTCSPYPPFFGTILGGYQSAKNNITTGYITNTGDLNPGSSRGPAKDGRIKPEVVMLGTNVVSVLPGNFYTGSSGTSMASPGVAGSTALLYQRYRQLHSNSDPDNALIKALICNGATDMGNKGVDYSFGFGAVNLYRSMAMLESNSYANGNATAAGTNIFTITVPANTASLKVMLYWNDPAASLLSTQKLVNDLDLEVENTATNTTVLPQLLNSNPANVNDIATTGADHINNIEQVVIDNPAAGTYAMRVKGTAIAQNPSQSFYVVYDMVPQAVQLTSPAGGEGLVPGETTRIDWEAYGNTTSTYTLQYSVDSVSWQNISGGGTLPAATRFFYWPVPDTLTGKAYVRVVQDATAITSSSHSFSVLPVPVITAPAAVTQCEGYINLQWNNVDTARGTGTPGFDYEVLLLRGDEMVPVGTTTATSFIISGLSKDSTYWTSVRVRLNGKRGRRAVAVARNPATGTCAGNTWNNDLKLDAIISPLSGRQGTSTALTAAHTVTIQIKNLDDTIATGGYTAKYSIDGGLSWVTEAVAGTINPGAVATYNFTTKANLSAAQAYNFIAVVKNNNTDLATTNDTLRLIIRQLSNPAISLMLPLSDNIEAAVPKTYNTATTGVDGDERFDFTSSTAYGRLRTFVNTGIAYASTKAFTLDASRLLGTANTNYLTGTFNLSNYTTTADDIRMDFWYNSHGQASYPGNEVWIRGSDTSAWIKAYDLSTLPATTGVYKKTAAIRLSELLNFNSQPYTSSFAIQWRQTGEKQAVTLRDAAGYTYDNIRLVKVNNDVGLTAITTPDSVGCGLSTAENVTVTVRNNQATTVAGVPVKYRINGGAWTTAETTPAIAGYATISYVFNAKAALSVPGRYRIEALASYSGDDFNDNDTVALNVLSQPAITSYPYLENFENGDGFWYTGGQASSWAYGTPASGNINRAASGSKAWKTSLTSTYNANEQSYLYSPCLSTLGMSAPTLSFALALDLEDCGTTLCDGAWVEYSTNGTSWAKLGAAGSGTNWYNRADHQLWSVTGYTRWHVATIALPAGQSNLRLRFVLKSDPFEMGEGIAVDDIHIYDNTAGIYDSITMMTPATQTVSGTGWKDFTSGGKLVASLNTGGQNIGTVNAQAYINTTGVRHTAKQYYHDRNITIKPATPVTLVDSVGVRFYFLDSETEALINAAGCTGCTKPVDVLRLGISKYTGTAGDENGTISDNSSGNWLFIPYNKVKMVPFDKGYYAEFKVKDFSEFWLNNGGINNDLVLPVKLTKFEAQRAGADALLSWTTAGETGTVRYEVEVAQNRPAGFVKIGELKAIGTAAAGSSYVYTDRTPDKNGLFYYRLKIIDTDGSFTYSPVRLVTFDKGTLWTVTPNPSTGIFNLNYNMAAGATLKARVLDAKGSLLKEYKATGNGLYQKLVVDIRAEAAAGGIYLLQVTDNAGKTRSFKLYVQR